MGKSRILLERINCKKAALPIGLLVVVLDQLSKLWVRETLSPYASVPQDGFLRISHVANPGFMFGLDAPTAGLLVLPAVALAITLFIYWRYVPPRCRLLGVAMGLFVGGCLGNLVDRVMLGSVVDFIDIRVSPGFGSLVFNVADVCSLAGVVVLALFLVRLRFAILPNGRYMVPCIWRGLIEAERRRFQTGQWWKPAPLKLQYLH